MFALSPHLRRHGFTFLFGTMLCLQVLPIWGVKTLALQDLGGHIELMDVMARYDDPNTIYSEVFDRPTGLRPNTLSLYVARFLHPLLSADQVAKLLLTLYVIGLPLSVLGVCRTYGRSRWLAFTSAPLAFNTIFAHGFINYLIGYPLLFVVMALAPRYAAQGDRRTGLLLGATLALAYFAHILICLIALGLAIFLLLLYAEDHPWRHRLKRLAPLLPVLPLIAWWAYRMFIALDPTEEGRTFGTEDGGLRPRFLRVTVLLFGFHHWTANLFRGDDDEIMLLALGFCWLAQIAASAWSPKRPQASSPSGFARAAGLEILTAGCLIAYFQLPSAINEVEFLNERIASLTLILLFLWPRIDFRGIRRVLIAPVVLTALLYPLVIYHQYAEYERIHIGAMPEAIGALPDRSRLFCEFHAPKTSELHVHPAWHLPKITHALKNGGITHESFASRPYTPIQFKAGQTPEVPRFQDVEDMQDYDYYLVQFPQEPLMATAAKHLKLIHQSGYWWLYEILPPSVEPRPSRRAREAGDTEAHVE